MRWSFLILNLYVAVLVIWINWAMIEGDGLVASELQSFIPLLAYSAANLFLSESLQKRLKYLAIVPFGYLIYASYIFIPYFSNPMVGAPYVVAFFAVCFPVVALVAIHWKLARP